STDNKFRRRPPYDSTCPCHNSVDSQCLRSDNDVTSRQIQHTQGDDIQTRAQRNTVFIFNCQVDVTSGRETIANELRPLSCVDDGSSSYVDTRACYSKVSGESTILQSTAWIQGPKTHSTAEHKIATTTDIT